MIDTQSMNILITLSSDFFLHLLSLEVEKIEQGQRYQEIHSQTVSIEPEYEHELNEVIFCYVQGRSIIGPEKH